MNTKSLFIATLCALLIALCAVATKGTDVDAILTQKMYMEHERFDLSTVGNYSTFADLKWIWAVAEFT